MEREQLVIAIRSIAKDLLKLALRIAKDDDKDKDINKVLQTFQDGEITLQTAKDMLKKMGAS